MKKSIIAVLISLLVFIIVAITTAELYVEHIFSSIINENPERAYDISYDDLDLHAFFKGLTLESARITPLHVSDTATLVHGTVEYVDISGIRWRDLIFSRKANIRELTFIKPNFDIAIFEGKKKKKSESSTSLSNLFGDILSRGEVQSFKLEKGSVEARHRSDSLLVIKIVNLTLEAFDIETDSIRAKHLIPFEISDFHSSLDSAYIHLNEYTEIRTGNFSYHRKNSELAFKNISLAFTKDPLEVSDLVGEQTDLIQADIRLLKISQLDAQSDLYVDLDIRARSVLIDGLVMRDFRDKNKPRPPDVEKPMFEGMVGSIPVPLKVDSIIIRNSDIYYSELAENKQEPGTVRFADINGSIINVTTIQEYQQQYQSFKATITSRLNQTANMNVALEVPYDHEMFSLQASVSAFNLDILNPTVKPMAGVEVTSGNAHKIDLKMNASRTQSTNTLVVDYDSLGLAVLKDRAHDYKKRGLISSIANSAIRHTNLPDHKHYQVAEYDSYRNIYRGPFNFMWETAKEGMLFIVPTGATGILIGDIEKKAKKKQKKQIKKDKDAIATQN
jgi:hypothetical protein